MSEEFQTVGVEFVGGPWDGQRVFVLNPPETINARTGPLIEPPKQRRPPVEEYYRWDGSLYVRAISEGDKK